MAPPGFNDEAHALMVDGAGNVYVTGQSSGSGTEGDYATIKYNAAGLEQWVARYDGTGSSTDIANAIAVDGAGNVYVTGASLSPLEDDDYVTLKYNGAGAAQWTQRYDNPRNSFDLPMAMTADAAGNVHLTGVSIGPDTTHYFATVKYNAAGDLQWAARFDNGPGSHDDETATAIAVDAAGNVYITGKGLGASSNFDYVTIKYASNGAQLWVARYNGPGNGDDAPAGIALDNAANVYMTGTSFGSGTQDDYATVKYNTAGVEQWVMRYNGPDNSFDDAVAIAVDGSGNIHVTGTSNGTVTFGDYATIKYNSAGAQQWVRRYNGPSSSPGEDAAGLALDGAGNVYVTGTSQGVSTEEDYATVKYNAAGVQQWVARFNGPDNDFDEAAAIVVDGAGNVYVTGTSASSTTFVDYATIKYSPASGSEQWVARYNSGPANEPGESFDVALALAVDDVGSVYVTGASGVLAFIFPFTDYATVKYNADGTPAGVARFDGPGFFVADVPTAITTDALGHVYVTGVSLSFQGGWSTFTTIQYDRNRVAVRERQDHAPASYWLSQSYPNPLRASAFNLGATIRYSLPRPAQVTLRIYDLSGREMATLVNAGQAAGEYEVRWTATDLPSGVYVYRLQAGEFTAAKKFIMLK